MITSSGRPWLVTRHAFRFCLRSSAYSAGSRASARGPDVAALMRRRLLPTPAASAARLQLALRCVSCRVPLKVFLYARHGRVGVAHAQEHIAANLASALRTRFGVVGEAPKLLT